MIFESVDEILKLPIKYDVVPHKKVLSKDLPRLEMLSLQDEFNEIVEILKRNPLAHIRNNEKLVNYTGKGERSMRINREHRVIFTVGVSKVYIWSAWGHYRKR